MTIGCDVLRVRPEEAPLVEPPDHGQVKKKSAWGENMPSEKIKVLYVSPEAAPFAKAGGLGDVAGSLPAAMRRRGHDARLIIPNHRGSLNGAAARDAGMEFGVAFGGEQIAVSIKETSHNGTPVWLVDCPRMFDRDSIYLQPDDGERFAVFCGAVLEVVRRDGWKPDVIHCNDWQTGLIPCLMKTVYADDPAVSAAKSVFTIHNLAYQGVFPVSLMDAAGVGREEFHFEKLEFHGSINLLKAGIVYADRVSTVSETYLEEILTPEGGHGLDGALTAHRDKLRGIVNGIDVEFYNPLTDRAIASKYSQAKITGKEANKEALLDELGLPYFKTKRIPVVAMVSRLAGHKGFDLVRESFERMMRIDMLFVLLGVGEPEYEEFFAEQARLLPDKVSVNIKFDEALARRVYAGADIFLMPSLSEPCGLGQMIGLRYGAAPVVRRTGGLADTVVPYNTRTKRGTGFVFDKSTEEALVRTMKKAVAAYKERRTWTQLMKNGMQADLSWNVSAGKYEEMYRDAVERE